MLTLALVVVTGLIAVLCYGIMLPFLPVLSWAVALTVASYPAHLKIRSRIPNEDLAAAVSVTLLALCILAPLTWMLGEVYDQISATSAEMPKELKTGKLHSLVAGHPRLESAVRWAERNVDLESRTREMVEVLGRATPSLFTGSVWSAMQLMLVLFTCYFLYRDRRVIVKTAQGLIPLPAEEVRTVFKRVVETIYATLYGTLVVAAVQGFLGGLMFWWLGLPAPALWGMVMGVAALIPYFGTFIIWAPAAIYLALQGQEQSAVILAVWGVAVVSMIDNLLYPFLVGKRLRFHTLPVFFFILGGISFFGASGLVLGPVTLAVTDALLDIWKKRLRASTTEAEASV